MPIEVSSKNRTKRKKITTTTTTKTQKQPKQYLRFSEDSSKILLSLFGDFSTSILRPSSFGDHLYLATFRPPYYDHFHLATIYIWRLFDLYIATSFVWRLFYLMIAIIFIWQQVFSFCLNVERSHPRLISTKYLRELFLTETINGRIYQNRVKDGSWNPSINADLKKMIFIIRGFRDRKKTFLLCMEGELWLVVYGWF